MAVNGPFIHRRGPPWRSHDHQGDFPVQEVITGDTNDEERHLDTVFRERNETSRQQAIKTALAQYTLRGKFLHANCGQMQVQKENSSGS